MNPYRLGPIHRFLIILTAVLLTVAAAASAWLSIGLASRMSAARALSSPMAPGMRHVFVLLSNEDPHFQEAFLTGARKAAADADIVLEVADGYSLDHDVAYGEAMAAAVDARLDGIIVQPVWGEMLLAPAREAARLGMPVITVKTEYPGLVRDCHVGINAFEFGSRMARMILRAGRYDTRLTVLYRMDASGADADTQLVEAGMRDVLDMYPAMRLTRVDTESNAWFGAEDTIRNILTDSPETRLLVCTTPQDTVAAAQTLLDLNRLDVQIVGADLTPEIQTLLDKNLIYGTVVRSAEEIGRRSVVSMAALLDGEPVSDVVDVELGDVLAAR